MKKFTVCLYNGSVVKIDKIIATKTIEADGIDNFDHIAIFYDLVKAKQHSDFRIYRNRITKKDFTVYYERTILLNDKVHTYDFGSYTRFIAVFEGNNEEKDLAQIINNARNQQNQ